MFKIDSEKINTEILGQSLQNFSAGAYVSFEGRVRNLNEGKAVLGLEYQVYTELALKEGTRILQEALEKYQILSAACCHRTGYLALGECAVWIGVISSHRRAAFEASQYIINEIKHRLPIWKQEYYEDGKREWVLCTHNHSLH